MEVIVKSFGFVPNQEFPPIKLDVLFKEFEKENRGKLVIRFHMQRDKSSPLKVSNYSVGVSPEVPSSENSILGGNFWISDKQSFDKMLSQKECLIWTPFPSLGLVMKWLPTNREKMDNLALWLYSKPCFEIPHASALPVSQEALAEFQRLRENIISLLEASVAVKKTETEILISTKKL